MEATAKSWRDFKVNLRRYFLRKGRNPCESYPFISKDDWKTFKKMHETDEFKEISEKVKESQKHNKDPHFVGKGGYKGNRDKWHKNDPIASLDTSSIDPSNLSSERSLDWIRARTKIKEDGSFYIPNDHTREVFGKMSWKGRFLMGYGPHVVTMTYCLVHFGIRSMADALEGLEEEQKSSLYLDQKKASKVGSSLWMN